MKALTEYPHVLHYVRREDRTPYGAVLAIVLPNGELRSGWSLQGPSDQSNSKAPFTKSLARHFALQRALQEEDSIETAKLIGRSRGSKIFIRGIKKAKGQLYVRENNAKI